MTTERDEWRGLKHHWSNDRETRTHAKVKCQRCKGKGLEKVANLSIEYGLVSCPDCGGSGFMIVI